MGYAEDNLRRRNSWKKIVASRKRSQIQTYGPNDCLRRNFRKRDLMQEIHDPTNKYHRIKK